MKNKEILTEKFILEKYLRRLNLKKRETFNFKNDGALIKTIKGKDAIETLKNSLISFFMVGKSKINS